jgi:hypothetical protein
MPITAKSQFATTALWSRLNGSAVSCISNSRRLFSIRATSMLLLLCQVTLLDAQTRVLEKKSQNPDIRITIEVDNREWKREGTASITGTIENLFDGPLEVAVTPTLYLSRPHFHAMTHTGRRSTCSRIAR